MVQLKSCPFCGNEVRLEGGDHVGRDGRPYWYVLCPNCGGSVWGSEDKERAIEAWNRRVNDG